MGNFDVSDGTISVDTIIQVCVGRSMYGYCGSQPAYDDDYDEVDTTVEIDYNNFFDWLLYQGYLGGLKERKPDLYHKFYDENDEWANYEPSDEELTEVIQDCIDQKIDFYGWAKECAQDKYNRSK